MSMHVYAYNLSIHVKFLVILVVICILYTTNFLWCIFDTSSITIKIFIKIGPHLA